MESTKFPFPCVAMAPEKIVLVNISAEESTEEAKIKAILELGNGTIEWDVASGITNHCGAC
jgi:hypothetical protein